MASITIPEKCKQNYFNSSPTFPGGEGDRTHVRQVCIVDFQEKKNQKNPETLDILPLNPSVL